MCSSRAYLWALQNKLRDMAVHDSRPIIAGSKMQDTSCPGRCWLRCQAKCARLRALCQLYSETIWLNANSSLRRRQPYNVRRPTMQGQVRGIEVRRPCSPLTIHPRYSRFPPPRIPRAPERQNAPFPAHDARRRTTHDARSHSLLSCRCRTLFSARSLLPPSLHAWERECAQTHPGIRASPSHLSRHPPTLVQYLTSPRHDCSPYLSLTQFLLFSPPHTLSSS